MNNPLYQPGADMAAFMFAELQDLRQGRQTSSVVIRINSLQSLLLAWDTTVEAEHTKDRGAQSNV